jgi:hypothetical protein
MREEINKAIDDFAKGNKDLAKILALFAAQMIVVFGRFLTKEMSDKMLDIHEGLVRYYEINIK